MILLINGTLILLNTLKLETNIKIMYKIMNMIKEKPYVIMIDQEMIQFQSIV